MGEFETGSEGPRPASGDAEKQCDVLEEFLGFLSLDCDDGWTAQPAGSANVTVTPPISSDVVCTDLMAVDGALPLPESLHDPLWADGNDPWARVAATDKVKLRK